ncbi:hypothetical protein BD414DRAFT_511699 [Trametes punicea]|nr:hypothetical protein BD414DRAFT_511699 [Trametes punicea]
MNMRERAMQEQSPSLCVNPTDVMGHSVSAMDASATSDTDITVTRSATPAAPTASVSRAQTPVQDQLSPELDSLEDFPDRTGVESNFSEEAISAIVSVLKSSAPVDVQESSRGLANETPSSLQDTVKPCELVAPRPLYPNQLPAFPRTHHPSLASAGSHVAFAGPRVPLADIRMQQIQQIQYPPFGTHVAVDLPQDFLQPAFLPPPPSPVLNAHTGIELEELRRRAEDFRMRNSGADLDKNFLQSFAGRLSARGELLDDYRCYVVGCGQRNKRRDHILVHVGSHVEHRPWRCQHCGMRFLRKNECKRHESSHGGRKPFSCPICAPYHERNFVRQDLLKRHMRVTHGVHDTSRASAKKRMEARKEEDAEYWP